MMKKKKNKLDELQERKLLEIESRGFWIAFWGLFVIVCLQFLPISDTYTNIATWLLFMGIATYTAVASVHAGIWDRKMEMNVGTCIVVSLVSSIVPAIIMVAILFARSHKILGSIGCGIISMPFSFALILAVMLIGLHATKKRRAELDAEPEEEAE